MLKLLAIDSVGVLTLPDPSTVMSRQNHASFSPLAGLYTAAVTLRSLSPGAPVHLRPPARGTPGHIIISPITLGAEPKGSLHPGYRQPGTKTNLQLSR